MSNQLRIQQFTRKKPKGISANALTKQVLRVLWLKGFNCWRQNNGAVYDPVKKVFRAGNTMKGVSDILGYNRNTGVILAVEIKAGYDKLSVHQTAFLEAVRNAGGIGLEVRKIEDLEIIK